MAKKHKYVLTIEFESEKPVKKHADAQIQFDSALGHFVEVPGHSWTIDGTFHYGSGKTKLKKVA